MSSGLTKLVYGWLLMMVGAATLLEAALPWPGWPRSETLLGIQGTLGFGLLVAGCWLRRLALKKAPDASRKWHGV